MSDDAQVAPGTPEAAETVPVFTIDDIERVLDNLVPVGKTVTWHDVAGNEHTKPAYASIKQQRKLLNIAREVWSDAEIDAENIEMAMLIDLLLKEENVGRLLLAFEVVFDDEIAEARELTGLTDVDDLVSGEEAVHALLPFFVGPLRRLLKTLAPALQAMGVIAAPTPS